MYFNAAFQRKFLQPKKKIKHTTPTVKMEGLMMMMITYPLSDTFCHQSYEFIIVL